MNLTRISIERPTLLGVIFIIVIVFGLLGYSRLNYELVPQFNPPVLTVATIYPGASPQEVEDQVSIIIEDALSVLENIDMLTTTSVENLSLVRLEMKAGTEIDKTLQDASRRLLAVADNLPGDARAPVLTRFDFNDLPVIRMGAFSSMDNAAFTVLFREEILPEINQIEGVADVRMLGGKEEEIMVKVDPARLDLLGVSTLQILNAIGSSNANIPAGFLEGEATRLGIIQKGDIRSLEDIRELVISANPRTRKLISIRDVAQVYRHKTDNAVISRINGDDAIGIDIKKQREANAVELSRKLVEKLVALENKFDAAGLTFAIAQDSSEFTLEAANAVMTDLSLAILLVSLVMLIFLHSLRNSLIVFVSIPTSIITTFIVMYLLNYSLNLLTLLGLSLAIGILVDDSIVVIENIYRHLEKGKDKIKASIEGRMEIGFTAISITLIDVVVFLPIIFATGMVADLLRQFSVVIITSTLMSLFVSFKLVPFLTSRFGKAHIVGSGRFGELTIWFENNLNKVIEELLSILKWSFRHPFLVGLLSFLLLAGSIVLIPAGFIGIEFTKAGDRSEFIMEIALRNDATLEESNRAVKQVEQILLNYPDVETIFTNVGITSSGRIEKNTSYLSEVYVKLVDKSQRDYKTNEFARFIKYRIMEEVPGVDIRPIEINLIGLRDDDAVQVTVSGNDRTLLQQYSEGVFDLLDTLPGTIEVTTSLSSPVKQVIVIPDRTKMNLLGVDLLQSGITMRTAFNGHREFSFRKTGKTTPIHIILERSSRVSSENIRQLAVLNNRGLPVPVGRYSTVIDSIAPSSLERTNRAPSVTIKSQVIGKPGGTVSNHLQNELLKSGIPDGLELTWGGATKRTREGISTMIIALAISILLVYLILVALYDSFYYPFVVLFSIPMAVIGALLALALSMQTLSIFSILGMIMLIGLVGKNAILVVDFTNSLKKEGLGTQDALLESVRLRFRPILMTNLTMIIGLMPIALATGAGSEWKNGLAWVLIGGLSSSMILTMVVVPVVYHSFDRLIARFIPQSK